MRQPVKTGICLAYTILILFIASAMAWPDIYRWVDDNGVVHFSDQVPDAKDDQQSLESMPSAPASTAPPTTSAAPAGSPEPRDNPQPTNKPAEQKTRSTASSKVDLYVTSWCKYCKKAKAYFMSRNIPFNEYDIEKDPVAALRRQKIDQRPGVPLAVINGYVIVGYSEKNYEIALKADR